MDKVMRIRHDWHTKGAIEWPVIALAEPVQRFWIFPPSSPGRKGRPSPPGVLGNDPRRGKKIWEPAKDCSLVPSPQIARAGVLGGPFGSHLSKGTWGSLGTP
jgi:hypothetical protein